MTIASHFDCSGVLRVGEGGRGFVLEADDARYVVTAAHCLASSRRACDEAGEVPSLPPAHMASYAEERTYPALLAPLGAPLAVWTECLYIDPIADVAVLGEPSHDDLSEQRDAYRELVNEAQAFFLGELPEERRASVVATFDEAERRCVIPPIAPDELREVRAYSERPIWMLSLDNAWYEGSATRSRRWVWVKGHTEGGMSGSPILNAEGAAVSVVTCGNETIGREDEIACDAAMQSVLAEVLPHWLAHEALSCAPASSG